ncbi:hypothetical protein GH714_009175 [Hevea brasiliensis]|uniref:Uncharacterized protein n=1 Tax=Hevea brasiliensis TaxID=3981 RepID=A0A6A6LY88_HEVBR|nr:hypothetical protein GH714_009175 [Hevea brasiliensis]
MSLGMATSACKFVRIKSTDKADLVLQLLRAKGFTQSQIACLISRRPQLILLDPDKILRPKIEYFESLGFLAPWLPRALCADPRILAASLKNRILPKAYFLRGFLETEENFILSLKRCFSVLWLDTELMMSKICTLCAFGVPVPSIRRLVVLHPKFLFLGFDSYEEKERKKRVLMSFGWSERDILRAFRAQPLFMTASEKKMKQLMEFYLTKACLQLSDLVRSPFLFMISLERIVIPRCTVLEVLLLKGLIKKDVNVVSALTVSKKRFEKKFFAYFKEDYPELIQAYQAKIFRGFGNKM